QADRHCDCRVHASGRAAHDRRRRSRSRDARTHGGPGHHVPGSCTERRRSRSVPPRRRDTPARRRGFRHRPARSTGVRAAGRRPPPRRRGRNGEARRDRAARGRAVARRMRRGGGRRGGPPLRPDGHPRPRRAVQPRAFRRPDVRARGGAVRVVNRHNRLLVTFHILSDALLALIAFVAAYTLRFHTGVAVLIPITKGVPPLRQYINVLPFIVALVPLGFHLQGLYRLRRGRSRVDDFFAVFVGTILAVVFGIVATLYVQTYFATGAAKDRGAFEVSQAVWGIFLVLNVALTFSTRELVREALERRWRAGIGLKRILIAGSGELGRLVADKILERRELGYQIVGFVDDRAAGDHLGYRGLP